MTTPATQPTTPQRRRTAALTWLLALAWLLTGAGRAAPDPIIGEQAPVLDGTPLPPRVVLVDFFATWCGPCHEAMAALAGIVQRRGVALVVVDEGEPAERVRAWVAEHPLPAGARLVIDEPAAIGKRWGQHRFPTTFVIGADGSIRHINRGYGSGYARRLDAWVAAELAAASHVP